VLRFTKKHLDSVIRLFGSRIPVPAFYLRLDPQSQVMTLAVAGSLLLHGAVLFTHFSFAGNRFQDAPPALDIVLVNSKSSARPFYADALAQANLDGGGNTDQKRRAKTPLPTFNRKEQGDALRQATARQKQLEAEQQRLLAELRSKDTAAPDARRKQNETPATQPNGTDLATSALAIARLEAQIARQLEEYQQRPRKAFVGARTQEYRFAQYVEDWRVKVERIGNLNYPEAARGRAYGALRLTVSIRADGSVENMEIDRSSGFKILDEAAMKIVRLAAPFSAFPPAIARDTDIVVITRTWNFLPGDRVSSD
jgi:protein TonB